MECRKGNTMKDSDGMRVLLFLLCESRDESILFLCAKNAKPVTATHVVNLVNITRILQRFLTVALSNFRGVCSTYSADHTIIISLFPYSTVLYYFCIATVPNTVRYYCKNTGSAWSLTKYRPALNRSGLYWYHANEH